MNILVIHNPHSGNAQVLGRIKQAFREQGADAGYTAITARNLGRKITQLAQKRDALVIAVGGDGTVGSVANLVHGTSLRLGIIPAGTLNHFARELGIPLDIPQAVQTALHGEPRPVDIATVNGTVFINNSSIGWYPRSLRVRDEHRAQIGKWPAAIMGLAHAALRPHGYHVELAIHGKQHTYRTPFVFVSNNPYKRTANELGHRETLHGGELGIYVVKSQSALGILRMLATGLFTRKYHTRDFAVHRAQQCTISTRHRRHIAVARDGEVQELDTPLRCQSRPDALRIIVPR